MEEMPESKRSSSALVPILIVVAIICVLGTVVLGVIGVAAFFFLGVRMPASTVVMPTPVAVTVAAVPVNPPSSSDDLLDQMAAGEVSVDAVTVSQPGETIGPVLSVQVSNAGPESIDTRLTCGTIFQPEDSGEQRLMVIQETMLTIPPGETADLDAYVACIDADRGAPSGEGDYSLSAMADDQLLAFAGCLCEQDIEAQAEADPMRALTVQFAVWSVSENIDLNDLLSGTATSEGALGTIFSGPLGEMLKPFMEDIVTQSATLINECGIDGEP